MPFMKFIYNWIDNSSVTGTIMNGNLWYCSKL